MDEAKIMFQEHLKIYNEGVSVWNIALLRYHHKKEDISQTIEFIPLECSLFSASLGIWKVVDQHGEVFYICRLQKTEWQTTKNMICECVRKNGLDPLSHSASIIVKVLKSNCYPSLAYIYAVQRTTHKK